MLKRRLPACQSGVLPYLRTKAASSRESMVGPPDSSVMVEKELYRT